MLNARLFMKNFERELAIAVSWDECRKAVEDACRELGFSHIEMSLAGEVSQVHISEGDKDNQYRISVPLTGSDYIDLTRTFFCPIHPTIVAAFIDTLRGKLREKLENGQISGPSDNSSSQIAETASVSVV